MKSSEEAQNKYIEDLADWKVEKKKFKEQKEAEARNEEIRTYQKKVSDHTQRINEFKSKHKTLIKSCKRV